MPQIPKNDIPMLETWAGEVLRESTGSLGAFRKGATFENFPVQGDAEKIVVHKAVSKMAKVAIGDRIPEETTVTTEKTLEKFSLGKTLYLFDREVNGTYPNMLKEQTRRLASAYDRAIDEELYDAIVDATQAGTQFVDASESSTKPSEFGKRLVAQMVLSLAPEYRGMKKTLVVNQFDKAEIAERFNIMTAEGVQAVERIFNVDIVDSDLVQPGEAILYVDGAFKVKYDDQELQIVLFPEPQARRTQIIGYGDAIAGVYDEKKLVRATFKDFTDIVG